MHDRAGQLAKPEDLTDIDALRRAYFEVRPNPAEPGQLVAFGTSGHRGNAFLGTFNEAHICAIAHAIADYRAGEGISATLFLGADTHALSAPALDTALEVFLARSVQVAVSAGGEFVPTPALSNAILRANKTAAERGLPLSDGVIITPSHNPPTDGGIKYNPPHGGPADSDATGWVAQRANAYLTGERVLPGAAGNTVLPGAAGNTEPPGAAGAAAGPGAACVNPLTRPREYDFLGAYVAGLESVIDFAAIRAAGLKIAAHPLGGAAFGYWQEIARRYDLQLDVLGPKHDPAWGFMSLDWDAKIRMDPSSKHVMQGLESLRNEYDLVLANDADADRFGVMTRGGGLIAPNDMLAVAIDHLLTTRTAWQAEAAVGKTLVSSALIDRVVAKHGRRVYEVPVGFKWFVAGLRSGELVFGGEESAGASFLTMAAEPWSTDKDGIIMCLLAAEAWAVSGKPAEQRLNELTAELGASHYARVDRAATPELKAAVARAASDPDESALQLTELAGEPVTAVMTRAPGNNAAIGGIKVTAKNAWFAVRPSGTEDVLKVYAESFLGEHHLGLVLTEAEGFLAKLTAGGQ